ncbi:MAG: hypothetical protein JXA42_17895 [Anaerolineales bacterium]|nr:hypothetical protein [Anaerolineales bacterium]
MKELVEKQIAEIEKQIDQLKASLPAHSTPPSMIIKLEDLEEELEHLRQTLLDPNI